MIVINIILKELDAYGLLSVKNGKTIKVLVSVNDERVKSVA
jgi:hypothetical protein